MIIQPIDTLMDDLANDSIDELICLIDGIRVSEANRILTEKLGGTVDKHFKWLVYNITKLKQDHNIDKKHPPLVPSDFQISLLFAKADTENKRYQMTIIVDFGISEVNGFYPTFKVYDAYKLFYDSKRDSPWGSEVYTYFAKDDFDRHIGRICREYLRKISEYLRKIEEKKTVTKPSGPFSDPKLFFETYRCLK